MPRNAFSGHAFEQPQSVVRRTTNAFHVKATATLDDHDAAGARRATQQGETAWTRRQDEEPVPRTEGRLHRSIDDDRAPDAARVRH